MGSRKWSCCMYTISKLTLLLSFLLLGGANPHSVAVQSSQDPTAVLDTTKLVISRNDRFEPVSTYCPKYSSAITREELALAQSRYDLLNRHLRSDMYPFMKYRYLLKAVKDKDISKLRTYLTIPIIVCLLLLAAALISTLVIPCVFCCCCRQPETHQGIHSPIEDQTIQQQSLVAVACVVGLIFFASLYFGLKGIAQAQHLVVTTGSVSCRGAQLIDTGLNGGASSDRTAFFTGMSTIQRILHKAVEDMTTTIGDLSRYLHPSIQRIESLGRHAHEDLEYVGSLKRPNSTFQLTYHRPTPATDSPIIVNSSFCNVLGTPEKFSSILGILHRLTYGINIVAGILGQTTKGFKTVDFLVKRGATYAEKYIGKLTLLKDIVDNEVLRAIYRANDYLKFVTVGYILFFVMGMVAAVLAVIATFAVSFGRVECETLAKYACYIGWFVALLGFIMVLVLWLIVPIMFMTCRPITQALSSEKRFVDAMGVMGVNNLIAKRVSKCLPGKDGKFLGDAPQEIGRYFRMATAALAVTQAAGNTDTSFLNFAGQEAVKIAESYASAHINDIIHDDATYNWFLRVAGHREYSACRYSPRYMEDRLVPSTDVKSRIFISCKDVPIVTRCQNFTVCPAGCIDLSEMMSLYPNVTSWKHDVYVRYEGGLCGKSIADSLGHLYTNWHVPRNNEVTGIRAVVRRLKLGALTNIDAIERSIGEIQRNFTRGTHEIRYLLSNISDKRAGLLAGANCKVLGEQGVNLKDAVCIRTFNNLYGILIATVGCAVLMFVLTCILGCLINKQVRTRFLAKLELSKHSSGMYASTLQSSDHPTDSVSSRTPTNRNWWKV